MTNIEIVFISVGSIAILLGIIGIAYAYYLCKKVVPQIDEIIHGHRFMFDTWLTLLLRLNEYMGWSVFYEYLPRLAEKRGWTEKAARIPRKFRRLLIINNLILVVGAVSIIVAQLIVYFHPEVETQYQPPSLPGESPAESEARPDASPSFNLPENQPAGTPYSSRPPITLPMGEWESGDQLPDRAQEAGGISPEGD